MDRVDPRAAARRAAPERPAADLERLAHHDNSRRQ
jgi:hypothetical protein